MMELIVIALIMAVFSADVTAYGQFMISRPIVCAPLLGYAFGNIEAGLWIGIIAEMLWISHIPMGSSIPFSITAVTLLTTVWSLKFFNGQPGVCAIALALALPLGALFRVLDIQVRYFNVRIVRWIEKGINQGKEGRITWGIVFGIGLFFIKAFIFYLVLIYPGKLFIVFLLDWMPPLVYRGFSIAWHAFPFVGFAVVLMNSCFSGSSCRK